MSRKFTKMKTIPHVAWGITPLSQLENCFSSKFLELRYFELKEYRKLLSTLDTVSLLGSIWVLTPEDFVERRERYELLLSACVECSSIACVIGLNSLFLSRTEAKNRVLELLSRWDTRVCPIYFDTGRLGPPSWLPIEACISDPLWFNGQIWGSYWKIHGWHEERWVRVYSESVLKNLHRMTLEYSPLCVVFAHSQRAQQLKTIQKIVHKNSKCLGNQRVLITPRPVKQPAVLKADHRIHQPRLGSKT